MRSSFGDSDISIPRERKGEFESQLIKKTADNTRRRHRRKDFINVCKRNGKVVR